MKKGEKRLLPQQSFVDATHAKIMRPKTWTIKDRLRLAHECRQKLDARPALTRKALARQLNMTTARLNQILNLPIFWDILGFHNKEGIDLKSSEPQRGIKSFRLSERALEKLGGAPFFLSDSIAKRYYLRPK